VEARPWKRIGLPWSEELVRRTHIAVAGTLLTARLALRYGLACNTAGGTHHAFRDHGSGFCIFNDIAFAVNQLRHEKTVERVLIIDLDVHQGDGTNHFFQNEQSVFTFSIHCKKNFPSRRVPGSLDIEMAEGTGDTEYLRVLREQLPLVTEQSQPDLVIYDAGVDPHEADALGKLCLTTQGLYEREQTVLQYFTDHAIPLCGVIGGGYDTDRRALVQRHAILHRVAREFDR
ncbi:MAG: histone deacetylase, partial [Cyanothece sp. SIO1E1]|nr:histone deacetylase [Cyanothece sp. SIO1E1]